MDANEIDAARKLAAKARERANATPLGPWSWSQTYEMFGGYYHWSLKNPRAEVEGKTIDGGFVMLHSEPDYFSEPWEKRPIPVFVAAARTDVPALADLVDQLAAALRQAQNAADDDYDNFAKAEQIKKARAMAGRMREMADHPNEPWAENAIRTGSYYEGLRLEAATIDLLCDALEQARAERDEIMDILGVGPAEDQRPRIATLESERDRYKAALEQIAEPEKYWGGDYMRRIARATLNPEAGNQSGTTNEGD